jgi:cytochrome c oxidase subunit II
MFENLPLFPEQASILAPQVDLLYLFLIAISGFFTVLIFVLILGFAIRYRKDARVDRTEPRVDYKLEAAWILIPFLLTCVMFVWGSYLYFEGANPPKDALDVYVIGKQWMWKIQHPEGKREINELHIPAGRPVRLIMSSVDVIHSFYVPAFRTKMDVLPGRYTTVWFKPTKAGRYHLFCAEYCGTQHSGMIGSVVVLEPVQYQRWLAGDTGASLPERGAALFSRLGCAGCHRSGTNGLGAAETRGPRLEQLFGSKVSLEGGGEAVADENYLRESILDPRAKITRGYPPVMPSYQGQISEESLVELIAYLKSIGPVSSERKEAP